MKRFQGIGKTGTIELPPRSRFKSSGLLVWGHIKSKVYSTPLHTLRDLRQGFEDNLYQ